MRTSWLIPTVLAVTLTGCSSVTTTTADTSSSMATTPTSSAPSSSTPSSNAAPSPSAVDFGPCVVDSGMGDFASDVAKLFGETQDALATGDVELFATVAPEQAKRYDEVGRQIKAASDCDDEDYGELLDSLGDQLIDIGTKMALVTEQSLTAADGSGAAQIQEIGQLVVGAGNEIQLVGEYIEKAT